MSLQDTIYLFTVNHKNVELEIREKFTLQSGDEIKKQYEKILAIPNIVECCLIDTCNRTEYYIYGNTNSDNIQKIYHCITKEQIQYQKYIEKKENMAAVQHLMRLACGLESMIIGENEILGQLRKQYQVALLHNSVGHIFNPIFQLAISVGKKARNQTSIRYGSVSVPHTAVELAGKVLGDLSSHSVCIIGTGKMARLTAEIFLQRKCSDIYIVSRSIDSAKKLANSLSLTKILELSQLENILTSVDIVIGCTMSEHYIISYDMMLRVNNIRNKNNPISIIDIAVPRNFDSSIHNISNVFYHNIDDLKKIISYNLQKRNEQEEEVMSIINKTIHNMDHWKKYEKIQPIVDSIKEQLIEISHRQIKKYGKEIKNDNTKKILEEVSNGIIDKIIQKSFISLKNSLDSPNELKQKIKNLSDVFLND